MFDVAEFHTRRKSDLGKELHYFEVIESTNATAEQVATEGAAEGAVVLANEQTAGRGRMDRTWFSPAAQNLYFSIVLRPDADRLHFLPFMAGLALVRALAAVNVQAELKWPNDVCVGSKKLAGILMQTSMEKNKLRYAILGVGVNVNTTQFPEQLVEIATSIAREKRELVHRESMLASILFEFERLYRQIRDLDWKEFVEELQKHSTYLTGCPVCVSESDRVVEGITAGLDAYGGLILETPTGKKVVYAGDVQSCRKE